MPFFQHSWLNKKNKGFHSVNMPIISLLCLSIQETNWSMCKQQSLNLIMRLPTHELYDRITRLKKYQWGSNIDLPLTKGNNLNVQIFTSYVLSNKPRQTSPKISIGEHQPYIIEILKADMETKLLCKMGRNRGINKLSK